MSSETTAKKNTQKLQRVIVDGLEDVKGQDIQVFNTEGLSPLFERVIVASGTSNRQTKALAASVRDAVRDAGFDKPRMEGEDNGEWIIVDCGQAVVHVMQPGIRQYYRLEDIWGGKPVRMKHGEAKPRPAAAAAPAAPAAPARKPGARKAAAAPAKAAPSRSAAQPARPAAAKKAAKKAAAPASAPATKPVARSAARPASSSRGRSAAAPTAAPVAVVKVGAPAKKAAAKKAAVKKPAASKAPAKAAPAKAPARKAVPAKRKPAA